MGKKFYVWSCVLLMIISSLILGWSYVKIIRNELPQESSVDKQDLYTRTNAQGAVRVSAKWLNPEESNAMTLMFNVSLDTHSINLDQYDLKSNTEVVINNQVITTGLEVDKNGVGHHVTNVLRVPIPKGMSTSGSNQFRNIQLTIMNLDNVPERVLTWNP